VFLRGVGLKGFHRSFTFTLGEKEYAKAQPRQERGRTLPQEGLDILGGSPLYKKRAAANQTGGQSLKGGSVR